MKLLHQLRRFVRRIVPPPRTPVRWSDALPLLVFAVLYGLVIWRLVSPKTVEPARWAVLALGIFGLSIPFIRTFQQRHKVWTYWLSWFIQLTALSLLLCTDLLLARFGIPVGGVVFTEPWQFGWIAAAVWVWWMALQGWSGLNRRRNLQSMFVRLCLLGVFVMLMAQPRAVRTNDSLAVVYAIDMSASIHPDQLSQAQAFVTRTVSQKPEGDEAGLVVFGSSAAVELPPEKSFPIDENAPEGTLYFNARIDRDATNLEQALSLGAAILPEDLRGRIVLISDGSETTGNLKSVLDQLRSRGISVDVLPVTYSYENEIWIERLELPQSVKIGEPYEASVVISAMKPGKAKLVLEENGQPVREEPFEVELQAGKNRIDIPIFLRSPGYYEYSATLLPEAGTDGRTENNKGVGYVYVEGEGKVLIVADPLRTDDRDFERLQQAIVEGERSVEVIDSYKFPRDPLSLLPYDCIVFANVPQDAFDAVQLNAVRDAIYSQGTGFLMIGGANSYGPGGYHRTVIEEALPVSMDISQKKVLPKGALAIILHTCEFPEGNTWAKRITKQAIKVLGSEDEVGVIAYGSNEYWVFELTPAGEYESLVPKINGASIGDMPAFGPTMQMALTALQKSDAASKHLIIISDGDPQAPPPQLIGQFVQGMISISTVAIFPHGGQEIGLLRTIANATGGRYYFPADPNELPSIFIKEAKTLKRSMIQEFEIQPQQGYPSVVMEGITSLPPLFGFVLTSLKENALAENVLFTADEKAEGDKDPVLAIWRYGLGTTAAFTSSLSNQWARDWVDWAQYRAFVKQLFTRISRVRKAGHLRMWTYDASGEGHVLVEDFAPQEQFLDVVAQVTGPGGLNTTIPLKQVGPRRYQGTFPANDKGRFQVTAIGKSGDREDRVYGGFIISYSPEYLKFTSNWNNLRLIKDATGGEELTTQSTAADIFNRRVAKQSSKPIFDWFLIALACLIPLDVAMRRVQLDWTVIGEWLGFGKKAATTQTMGSLLARKEKVGEQLRGERETRPLAPTKPAPYQLPPKTTAPPPPPKAPPPAAPPAAADESTMGRLLRQKREREQGSDQ
ncbi:VWA domain-containing protein [Planctomicrobium piriforme]|uniref:von Willebrand factor type A domain-containing protein n=1 Tax=Planctomicrobium piriforme TaxID=1576369 RepID=A0A1I3BZQ3_9PLAN|nr:VWA domain-containing protein [Planctomicrobium piriforme]SFH67673.1 von Willebrand factor type A domain-containing protein [Planctomicrobium piriforme]